MRLKDRFSFALCFAALAVAVLAVGGAMRWAQASVAVLAAGSLVPLVWSRSAHERVSPIVALLGIAAALTTLQLVPLPSTVLEFLNPTGTALREDGAALMDVSPWSAITLDAPATLRSLGFFFILIAVVLIALRLAVTERGRYRLCAMVALTCAATALIVAVHVVLGAESLYGLYRPRAKPAVLGPLLNENHLGGLMAMGATTAAGLVMYRGQRSWQRAGWLMVVAACGVVGVSTQSRGAMLALLAGMFVTVSVFLAQRFTRKEATTRGRLRFVTSSLPIGILAASAIVVIVYSSAGGLERELGKTSLQDIHEPRSKFAAWRSAQLLVEEAPWFGVGRGAMESSFTRVHASSGFATFSHLENEYLQAVVDFGVPGTILLGVCSLWLVGLAIRRWRDGPLAAGAFGSIACIALQSSIDFGVELLGLAIPLTILVATVVYTPIREVKGAPLFRARAVRVGLIIVLLTSAVTLFTGATTSVAEDHDDLATRKGLALDDLEASIARHPLDYYGYALAADAMIRANDRGAIRMLNHAMRLHPTHPGLHRIAARLLLRSGHVEQAAGEYAMALRYSDEPQRLLAEIVGAFSPDQAIDAIPTNLSNLDVIVRALRDLKQGRLAGMWVTRVLGTRKSARVCDLWFSLLLEGVDLPLEAASPCLKTMPDRQTRLALANVMVNKQRYAEAIVLINDVETWTGRIDERAKAWLVLCDVHSSRGYWTEATKCLRRLDASGDLSADQRPAIDARLEQIESNRRAEDLARELVMKWFWP